MTYFDALSLSELGVRETGIERHFREEEEAEEGFECLCGSIPHNPLCKMYNQRKRQEREMAEGK